MPRKEADNDEASPRVVGISEVAHLISPSDPKVAQLIEEANATGDMDGFVERIEALLNQRLPPGVRLATDKEVDDAQRQTRRVIQLATKPLLSRGWRRTGSRLVFDAPSGHWADIMIDVRPGPAPVLFFLFAVVGSPYLLRVNGGDGTRPRTFHSGHLSLLWQMWIEYDPASTRRPKPLALPQHARDDTHVRLGAVHAQAWLTELFERLATTMEGLCSDQAMRDWLVDRGLSAVGPLRYAVLLSHHLGDLDRQQDLVERARARSEASEAYLMSLTPPIKRNDRGRDPLFWSHNRFMRFVSELPD